MSRFFPVGRSGMVVWVIIILPVGLVFDMSRDSSQWLWRMSSGLVKGRLTTEELEQLVVQGRVLKTDRVKLEDTGEWIPGSEVIRLFGRDIAEPMAESASAAAARVLGQKGRIGHQGVLTTAPRRNVLSRCLASVEGLLGGIGSGVSTLLSMVLAWLAGLKFLWNWRSLAACIAIALSLAGWQWTDLGWRTRSLHRNLTLLAAELEAFQRHQPDDQAWQHLQKEVLPQLETYSAELRQDAKKHPVRNPSRLSSRQSALARQQLILSVESLSSMMRRRDLTGARWEQFRENLQLAERHLSGATPLKATPPEVLYASYYSRQRPLEPSIESANSSFWMFGILVVDGALIVGGLMYWWKWRSVRSA